MVTAIQTNDEAQLMESVLLGGDLSKLSPAQRVNYYNKVCSSMGLNPLTKPFDYINLNGKLTLYARKDATEQLRKIHNVCIDDVDIQETEKQFVVKVKGHDKDGRTDVEVGVVNKTDMRGDIANVQMKAVTKAKRRLTLSLCGLGWLDETEVQTIPDAQPVIVDEGGEIVTGKPVDPEEIYKESARVKVKVKGGAEKMLGELSKEQLDYVIKNSLIQRNADAAAVVMQHDFGMKPEEHQGEGQPSML